MAILEVIKIIGAAAGGILSIITLVTLILKKPKQWLQQLIKETTKDNLAKTNNKIKLRRDKQVYRQDIKKPQSITAPANADKFTLYGYEILPVGVEDMTKFEQLISIVRDNKLLIDTDLSINKEYLKILRKLRNKIHLTTATDYNETDYNIFSFKDYLSAKYFLLCVLRDSIFGKEKQNIFPRMFAATEQQVYNFKFNHSHTYIWIS